MDRILRAARASGSLNLSNRSLREVPVEIYRSLDAVGEGEKWWEMVELQKLILAHNEIEVLKEEIRNLSMLTVLNISHNKLSQLPAAIGELPLLKTLDVSFNALLCIPEEIGSVIALIKMDCSNNQLSEIPSSLGKCSELSELKASNNTITRLRGDLKGCSKLFKLDVEGNKLTMLSEETLVAWTSLRELNAAKNLLNGIPNNIGVLSSLIRLDLSQNKISSIPSSISGCKSLAEFYLGNNTISTLPTEMRELSSLGTLDLHSNKELDNYGFYIFRCLSTLTSLSFGSCKLRELSLDLCKLRLSMLDLSNNCLAGLPPELGTMTTLRKLLLNGNPLRTLRSSLVSGPTPALLKFLRSRLSAEDDERSEATSMKKDQIAMAARLSMTSKDFSLSGLGLSHVPPTVWESAEITRIDVSQNSIEELPKELTSCVLIQDIILSGNKIKMWPGAVLASLPNLSCLKLDNNLLTEIPSNGFSALSKLQVLDLSGNMGCLPKPPGLSSLPNLQELYLRRMQLTEVPTDVLNMVQLRVLDLSQNSITSIPEEVRKLTFLLELDLSNNNIGALPIELGLLEPSLHVLKLDGNPLRSIRRVILDRGTKAILNYLKDKLPE